MNPNSDPGRASRMSDALQIMANLSGETVTSIRFASTFADLYLDSALLRIQAEWKLVDGAGKIIDYSQPFADRKELYLWKLVDERVVDMRVSDEEFPKLTVQFSNGWSLAVESDGDNLEDWQLIGDDQSYWLVCNGGL